MVPSWARSLPTVRNGGTNPPTSTRSCDRPGSAMRRSASAADTMRVFAGVRSESKNDIPKMSGELRPPHAVRQKVSVDTWRAC